MEPLECFVKPARRPEIGQLELAARVLEAVPEDVERAAPLDLAGESPEELLLDGCPVVLLELFPFLGLGRQDEIDDVARQEAERRVVLLGRALAKTAGRELAVGHRLFADARCFLLAGIRPKPQERALDRLLEASFGDFNRHGLSPGAAMAPRATNSC